MATIPGVLIVDDHPATRSLLRAVFRAEGWSVLGEAATAEQGLAAVRQLKPDVVCLDVVMPGASGVDILGLIKEQSPGSAIVMVTASATADVVAAAMERGADGFLVKPFDRARMIETLRSVLQRHGRA